MPRSAPVLVVDDDLEIREGLRDLLEDEGFEVETAENGAVALQRIAMMTPCLMLLDLMMPVLNGEQVIASLRAAGVFGTFPIVAVTANNGANVDVPVLRKPFKLPELLEVIELHCERR